MGNGFLSMQGKVLKFASYYLAVLQIALQLLDFFFLN